MMNCPLNLHLRKTRLAGAYTTSKCLYIYGRYYYSTIYIMKCEAAEPSPS